MQMTNKCKICGSEVLFDLTLYGVKFIYCKNCQIHYLKNFPKENELKDYYTTEYKIEQSESIEREKRRIFRLPEQYLLLSEINNFRPAPATMLDIGCDRAYFLDEARRIGYNVFGIEPSEHSRQYCNLTGINSYPDLKEFRANHSESIDIITMWHSLEHFTEPVEFLNSIREYLNKDAVICIRVPDFNSIWRKIFKRKWVWFQPENHYFHYNYNSIRRLLEITGFEVLLTKHQKPNNRFTKKMYKLSNSFMRFSFGIKSSIIPLIKRKYEDLVGDELFIIAKIINKK